MKRTLAVRCGEGFFHLGHIFTVATKYKPRNRDYDKPPEVEGQQNISAKVERITVYGRDFPFVGQGSTCALIVEGDLPEDIQNYSLGVPDDFDQAIVAQDLSVGDHPTYTRVMEGTNMRAIGYVSTEDHPTYTLDSQILRTDLLTKRQLDAGGTVDHLITSTAEELGEFCQAYAVETGRKKKIVDEHSNSEAIDIIICGLALYFARGGQAGCLAERMARKLDKWEGGQPPAA